MHELNVNVFILWEWKKNKIDDYMTCVAGPASKTPNKSKYLKQKRSNEYNCGIAAFGALLYFFEISTN